MMDCLSSLPNEIIFEILGHIKPRDIENFTTSCKKLYLLGVKQRRQHRALKTSFQRVLQARQGSIPASGITELLYQILIELDKVVISKKDIPLTLHLSTIFAALLSVTSLKASGIIQESPSHDELTFPLTPRSSDMQDLTLEGCTIPDITLFNLIKSTKSLQCFTYSQLGNYDGSTRNGPPSAFVWACAALVEHASTSLKKLTLRSFSQVPESQAPLTFKSCDNLRVLSVDFALLMGNRQHATNEMITFLPTSLKVLNLHSCVIESLTWLLELVNSAVESKGKERSPRLEELHFKGTHFKRSYTALQIGEVCEVARQAGIETTVTCGDTHR